MKIISKYKDFYDYLAGVYGVDPALVYDRRHGSDVAALNVPPPEIEAKLGACAMHALMCVGNECVHVFAARDQVLTHFDLVDKNQVFEYSGDYRYDMDTGEPCERFLTFTDGTQWMLLSDVPQDWLRWDMGTGRDAPAFARCFGAENRDVPILIAQHRIGRRGRYDYETTKTVLRNPCLQRLGLYFNPDWLWRTLSQFLSDARARTEVRTDVADALKIVSKGFDAKISFRPHSRK